MHGLLEQRWLAAASHGAAFLGEVRAALPAPARLCD